MSGIALIPVTGLPEVRHGDVLAELIVAAAPDLQDGDVVVTSRAVVSTVEDRTIEIDPSVSLEQVVVREGARVLRRLGDRLVTETAHGFVCDDAGIERSSDEPGLASLLPVDPDRSARRIHDGLRAHAGADVGVIVSDTFGRPWRAGVTGVAIGCAGIAAVVEGVCVADELAGAAELVMGTSAGVPVAIVRGVDPSWLREGSIADEVVRAHADDLFR